MGSSLNIRHFSCSAESASSVQHFNTQARPGIERATRSHRPAPFASLYSTPLPLLGLMSTFSAPSLSVLIREIRGSRSPVLKPPISRMDTDGSRREAGVRRSTNCPAKGLRLPELKLPLGEEPTHPHQIPFPLPCTGLLSCVSGFNNPIRTADHETHERHENGERFKMGASQYLISGLNLSPRHLRSTPSTHPMSGNRSTGKTQHFPWTVEHPDTARFHPGTNPPSV